MKKYILKTIPLFTLFLLFVFPLASFIEATSYKSEETTILGKEAIVKGDYFAAGKRVVIEGTVDGDAYIAGGEVTVNGIITGDLIVAAGEVVVRGNVEQNIRGAGGSVVIEGKVGRNVSLIGGSLTIDRSAKVNGNGVLVGGNIDVLSEVKNLSIAGGDVNLQSIVSGDINAAVGSLLLSSGSLVQGNINYWSDKNAEIAPGASVSGKITYNKTNLQRDLDESKETAKGVLSGGSMFFEVISFITSLILGLFLLRFLPVYSQKTANFITDKLWLSMFLGFIVLVVTPFLVLLLLVTLVGIPIAFIVGFMYTTSLYFSKLFVIMALGRYLSKRSAWNLTPAWAFVFGLIFYYLLSFIPILGGIVKFSALLAGTGALFQIKREYFADFRNKKLI